MTVDHSTSTDLDIAADLIARSVKLKPSTRLMRQKFIARIRRKNELPTFKSIGYWRNYIAALQMQVADSCKPLMVLALDGEEDAVRQIRRGIAILQKAKMSRPPEGERKRRVGRITTLARVRPGWQEQVYSSISEKWRNPFAVIALTGCRPGELNGLEYSLTERPGVVHFSINGKKVTESAGQPKRELNINVSHTAYGRNLIQYLMEKSGNRDALEISDSPQAITKAITRAAQRTKVIRLDQTLPAYACRNAVAAGMKAAGRTLIEVAGALGHSTDRCQQFYGRARSGFKSGGEIVLEVMTARSVKKNCGRTLNFQTRKNEAINGNLIKTKANLCP